MERKGPGPTDPLVRAEPPFDWYRTPTEVPRRVETPERTPITLDPDIALWPVTPLSRWPFIGPPTEGMWPVGWMGVDATGTIYTCTVGGEPGTWAAQGGSSGQSLGIWFYGDGSDGPLKFTASPRTVTDAVTNGTTTLTSATAAFTGADVGLILDDSAGAAAIPSGTRIESVTNATTIEMTCPASAAGSADTVVIGSSVFVCGSYSTITIPTGATAIPFNAGTGSPGAAVCSGEYFIDGTVDLSGSGDPRNAGSTGAGANGQGYWQPAGGNGGAGSTSAPGDTPGGIWAPTNHAANNQLRQPLLALIGGAETIGGVGGSAGGGDGVNNGGDGGNGGKQVTIVAKSIVHGPNASYILTGQAGGIGGTGGGTGGGGVGDCGGGGGGPDGWWITFSDTLVGAPSIIGGGGAGGAGHGTGTDGTAGKPGFGVHYTPSGVIIQNA